MPNPKLRELFQLLQSEHPSWTPDESLLEIWDQAVGALPGEALLEAGRRYLETEPGRPQLAKFLKCLPQAQGARVRNAREGEQKIPDRPREEVFQVILADCRFSGERFYGPGKTLEWMRDRYLVWRSEHGEEAFEKPPHWSEPHHSKKLLLAFLDRFVGLLGSTIEVVDFNP